MQLGLKGLNHYYQQGWALLIYLHKQNLQQHLKKQRKKNQ